MAKMIVSHKRAKAISVAVFLVGIAIVTYLDAWWPGIMLAVGVPLALRQYLVGRHYDMGVSLFIFIGVFATVQFNISWILLPVLFALGGLFILFREFLESDETTVAEEEEDLNHEIEEDQHK
ncbi:MAG: hypothetical protein V4492_02305 [Chlamydiota bacterium]